MFKVVKGHGSIRKFRTGAVVAVLALSFSGVMVSAEETVTNANADTVATEVSSDVAEAQSESSAVAERSPISEEPNTEIPQSQGIIHVTPNGDGTYSSTEPYLVEEPASEQVANAKENVDEAQDAVNKQEEVVANAAEVVQNKQDEVNAINSASPNTNVTQNQLNTAKDDVTNMQNQVADATSKHEEALSNQNASSIKVDEAKPVEEPTQVNTIVEAQVETPVATPVANSVLVGNTNNDTQLPKTSSDAGLLMTAVGWLSLAGITLTRKRKSSTTSTDS